MIIVAVVGGEADARRFRTASRLYGVDFFAVGKMAQPSHGGARILDHIAEAELAGGARCPDSGGQDVPAGVLDRLLQVEI